MLREGRWVSPPILVRTSRTNGHPLHILRTISTQPDILPNFDYEIELKTKGSPLFNVIPRPQAEESPQHIESTTFSGEIERWLPPITTFSKDKTWGFLASLGMTCFKNVAALADGHRTEGRGSFNPPYSYLLSQYKTAAPTPTATITRTPIPRMIMTALNPRCSSRSRTRSPRPWARSRSAHRTRCVPA